MPSRKKSAGGAAALSAERRKLMQKMLRSRGIGRETAEAGRTIMPAASRPAPLSFAQERLWFLEQMTPNSSAYVFTNIVRISGPLDPNVLHRAFEELVNRHENLRTAFREVDGELRQVVVPSLSLPHHFDDLSTLPDQEKEDRLERIAESQSRLPFDLTEPPLLRLHYARLQKHEIAVVLTIHHIVYDGWSLSILFRELDQLYRTIENDREMPPPPLEIQYSDFAAWQRTAIESPAYVKQLEYWKNTLATLPPTLQLPTDRPRPSKMDYSGRLARFSLSPALSKHLRALAKREGCTQYTVLLSAFYVLLNRYCDEHDLAVGTPVANRTLRELEALIGFFVNTLVVRTDLSGNPTFSELIERVRRSTDGALSNQDYPFDRLVDVIQPRRLTNQNPIFQTMFAFQNTPAVVDRIGDASIAIEEFDNHTAVFDLTLNLYEVDEQISGYFEYSTELFEAESISRMIESYRILLEHCVRDPETAIDSLEILPESDRTLIYESGSTLPSSTVPDQSILDQFHDVVTDNPLATAITAGSRTATFAELNAAANAVAKQLVASGIQPNQFVGICLPRSFEMFAAILGVMKSGAAYLPLDPGYPESRLTFMLEDSTARVLITARNVKLPDAAEKILHFNIDEMIRHAELDESEVHPLTIARQPDDLAYAIYTSGSTGMPKAVLISNRNLSHSNSSRIQYFRDPVESFLLMSSFAFDSSIAGIFWTLCTGGNLVLPADGQERDVFEISQLVKTQAITHVLCLPTLYSLLLESSKRSDLGSLRVVCVAGEECSANLVRKHFEQLPHTALYNEYGPTECTVWSTVHKFSPDEDPEYVPIGRAIPNSQVFVLDSRRRIVPVGVPGELHIGGNGVAVGYLDRADLTEQRFVELRLEDGIARRVYRTGDLVRMHNDGNLEFLGRIDGQVKISGYRIELGEIENAVLETSLTSSCAVVPVQNDAGDWQLVAYVVSKSSIGDEVKSRLKATLPAYMVPTEFVAMPELPLTPNGKIDRNALPSVANTDTPANRAIVEPRTDVQKALALMWQKLLGRSPIGIDDNFFEIGGNSLSATRFIGRVFESFDIRVPVRFVFDYPTLGQFSDALANAAGNEIRQLERTAELILQIENMSESEIDQSLQSRVDRRASDSA